MLNGVKKMDKIVRFPDGANRFYDLSSHELYAADGTAMDLPFFKTYERNLLEFFISNAGRTLSRDEIIIGVTGITHTPFDRTVDVHVSNLRKAIGKSAIKSVHGIGYRYEGLKIEPTEIPPITSTLPKVLTNTSVPYADEQSIIHREKELAELEKLLSGRKNSVLLTGFGGIGKTSIARVLYGKLSSLYDSIGWVEYRENLKNSLLACSELADDIANPEMRWKILYQRLKNDPSMKLLIIDNVDSDIQFSQFPTEDRLLQEISGWPNMSVLLTSRLDSLTGYQSYPIGYLNNGGDSNSFCVDLFYFWYDRNEYRKPANERVALKDVTRLVNLAGCHTYAVEILAKSARYEPSLTEYADHVEDMGFQFPSLQISTGYKCFHAIAAEQLRNLFRLQSRAEKEKCILWDFSILPNNMLLTPNESMEWLGYSGDVLDGLIREGWLTFRGGFSIHPLVKETMFLDLVDGKAPDGTAGRLLSLLENGDFFNNQDSFSLAERKLKIAENIINYVLLPDRLSSANVLFNVGNYFFNKVGRRLSSISCFEKALNYYRVLDCLHSNKFTSKVAWTCFRLGYVESATKVFRKKSEVYLRESVGLFSKLHESDSRNIDFRNGLGQAKDHLGYVLSDYPEQQSEALCLLESALSIWTELQEMHYSEFDTYLATTCDNLGRLLTLMSGHDERAETLLRSALQLRCALKEKEPGLHETEIPWTHCNLGDLLAKDEGRLQEAESQYRSALDIYLQIDREFPGVYTGDVAWTYARLANLISHDTARNSEALELYKKADNLKQSIDDEHTGFFIEYLSRSKSQ